MKKEETIEKLKKQWRIDELKFVATFCRPKKENGQYQGDFGFFNDLTNYYTGRKVFYPNLNDLDNFDSKISYRQNFVDGLIDGNLYYIELGVNSKKRYPYSIIILNVTPIDQEQTKKHLNSLNKKTRPRKVKRNVFDHKPKNDILNALLEDNNIHKNLFYGQLKETINDLFFLKNVISKEEGNVLLYEGKRIDAIINQNKLKLEVEAYYEFSIESAILENRKVFLNIVKSKPPVQLKINPFKDFIRLRSERLDNPEANKIIANLMEEIGKGMYSSKQRMIFELLQNADDAPSNDHLGFYVDYLDDYLLIMHDGIPFNMDDVEAITSAAESTKRNDKKKTGYKGIGFKSVFTDSEEVIINSGGYLFSFDQNNPSFNDFDAFYLNQKRHQDHPDLMEEDKKKFKKQRRGFKGAQDIPWQIVPFWLNEIPKEISDSESFNLNSNNVKFAIKFGKENIASYLEAINNFSKSPQFMLFLRNTTVFNSVANDILVKKSISKKDIVNISKSSKGVVVEKLDYLKRSIKNIPVSDGAFSELKVNLIKSSEINDYGEISYFFTNKEGKRYKNIPPKLASIDDTEITFAIPIFNNRIGAESDYINDKLYSSLFTFLPMEEKRFQLPFLVNADFVPSSDREEIQGDNPWNIYIMAKIAESHVFMLEAFAKEYLSNNTFYLKYLSLLLKEPIVSNHTAQDIIDKYNEVYLNKLGITNIVVTDNEQIITVSKTILDLSGLTEIFSNDLFYKIKSTEKRLPHKKLHSKYLKYEYLDIEKINLVELISLMNESNYQEFGVFVSELPNEKYSELLTWLDKVAALDNFANGKFGDIPFIKHNNKIYSINDLLGLEDAWILNENTLEIQGILISLGFDIINLDLEKNDSIDYYIKKNTNYTNNTDLGYSRIAISSLLKDLSPKNKSNLLVFFENSDFMRGKGIAEYIDKLQLFKCINGNSAPLSQMLNPTTSILNSTLKGYAILPEEFHELPDRFKVKTIDDNQVFENFLLNAIYYNEWIKQFNSSNIEIHVSEVKNWYNLVENKKDIVYSHLDNVSWLYTDDEYRFEDNNKVYCPNSLYSLDEEKYNSVYGVLEQSLYIPIYQSSSLVKELKLNLNDNAFNDDFEGVEELSLFQSNDFLDWLEDNEESSFLKNWTFTKKTNGKFNLIKKSNKLYNSTRNTHSYIQNDDELKEILVPFPSELCSDTRYKIGLLEGDVLLNEIIDSHVYKQSLAQYFNDDFSDEKFKLFIENLSEFNLFTSNNYDKSSPEHKIINKLLSFVKINQQTNETLELINIFRNKININNNSLSNQNIVDKISFTIDGVTYDKLKLSDVVSSYKGESDILSEIIDSFTDINAKVELGKKIFNTELMSYVKIYSLIKNNSNELYLNTHQLVFMFLYRHLIKLKTGKIIPFSKDLFDDYYVSGDLKDQIIPSYLKLLDLLFELNFPNIDGFVFLELEFKNLVYNETAIESEAIPEWVTNWMNVGETEKRIIFLSKLGLNIDDSSVVNYRKAMIAKPFEIDKVNEYYTSVKLNETLLWNSIIWLSNYSSEIVTQNIETIKKTLTFVDLSKDEGEDEKEVFVPIIDNLTEVNTYKLIRVVDGNEFHLMNNDWGEWTIEIFNLLQKNGKYIIDNNCPVEVHDLINLQNIIPKTEVNGNLLLSNSELYDELYYKKWKNYSQYKIYIYNDNKLPKILTYNDLEVTTFLSEKKYLYDGNYFISKHLKDKVLNSLPDEFPESALEDLRDWYYRTLEDESLLNDIDYGYNETVEKILRDRFGLNEEEQKEKNNESKVSAVHYLIEQGYDLSESTDLGYKIENILSPDGIEKDCLIHSAVGGMLYLGHFHWKELEKNNSFLLTIYPGGEPRIFNTRQELLNEELNEFLLFRVDNTKSPEDIDKIFENLNKKKSHMMMVTSQKMREKLYDQFIKQKRNTPVNDIANPGGNLEY
ncbi:sacsin N-terminal ATP-binding-like domain-containing protein [Polaribacter sp. AHE13PA]|uniref:sacsin N-terminal ATP-binding-like domain-containing protein n=1 Tax=Polaribacter sp. AHE13PA TaxID=2745562 RepID=UPI001C4F5B63|nr:hypothetical protein [Polaribacter sp. AHE13PA]QXP65743.1 hypothetical protein H0I28_11090 [Polaribacter sp. AHE13PA]